MSNLSADQIATPKTDAAVFCEASFTDEGIPIQLVPARFARDQERTIADLLEALRCLLPGLVLDLRHADDDDDHDALRARIKTVQTAILKATGNE